jgi:hypothetical protein
MATATKSNGELLEETGSLFLLWAENRVEIAKLKGVSKTVLLLSSAIKAIIIVSLFFIMLVLFSLGLSIWISNSLHSAYSGFIIMGVIYAVIIIIVYFLREKWINAPVTKFLLNKILN